MPPDIPRAGCEAALRYPVFNFTTLACSRIPLGEIYWWAFGGGEPGKSRSSSPIKKFFEVTMDRKNFCS
jgi:hypothetical protein